MPFSFLNAAFLVGIAAAAIPILIHLFSRRKVSRVPFSSLQFLEEIARRRLRRMRLTQWIILALRVLALALLALALGRPAVRGDFAFGKSRGQSAVAFVLDRSYSMRVEGSQETLWEKAKTRAKEALDVMEATDTILLLGVEPEGSQEAFSGRAAAEEAVRALDAGYGTTDLPGAVRRAGGFLRSVTTLNRELFIISDFQRSGLRSEASEDIADLTQDLPPGVRVFLVPVEEGPLPNTAMEAARLEGSALEFRVRVDAVRHGGSDADLVTVTVEAGTEVLGEGRLSLPVDSRESVEIPLTRVPAEDELLLARLSRDRLDADDVRYLSAEGAGRVLTAVVQEPASPSPYLSLALSPTGNAGPFVPRGLLPGELVSQDLSDVRLLVLDNVTTLPPEAVARLREWREAGGAIFLVMGDRVDLRFYNESLLPVLFPHVTLGNLLGTDEATAATYTLTARHPGHQAFSGFQAQAGDPITGAVFWRIVEVRTGPGVRTLAEFGPGLPAMVQGEGALLFASSLDGRWNNFPTHAAFVPLLHQALEALLAEESEAQVRVGDPVEGIVDRGLVPSGVDAVCAGPGSIELPVKASMESRGWKLQSAPAPVPGHYAMRAGDRVLFRRAVNVVPRAESDLLPATREELRQAFPGDRVRVVEADMPLGTPVREARYGREIWRELVVVVVLLMITEGWLSRRGVA